MSRYDKTEMTCLPIGRYLKTNVAIFPRLVTSVELNGVAEDKEEASCRR